MAQKKTNHELCDSKPTFIGSQNKPPQKDTCLGNAAVLEKQNQKMQLLMTCYLFNTEFSNITTYVHEILDYLIEEVFKISLPSTVLDDSFFSVSEMMILDENMEPLMPDSFWTNTSGLSSLEFSDLDIGREATIIENNDVENSLQNNVEICQNSEKQNEIQSSDIDRQGILRAEADDSIEDITQGVNLLDGELLNKTLGASESPYISLMEGGNHSAEESNDQASISVNDKFLMDNTPTRLGSERKRKKFALPSKERKNILLNRKIEKHSVKDPCNCKMKCMQNFTEEIRKKINNRYWKLNFSEQKQFISNNMEIGPIKRRRKEHENLENNLKNANKKYYLRGLNGQRYNVCRGFFLTTLGYAANNDTVLRYTRSPPKDQRGSYERKQKTDQEIIKKHVQMFSPCVSHYRREHAPLKLYLPSDISIRSMHADFIQRNPSMNVSYDVYRLVVTKQMNISFAKLGNEQCEKCELFFLHKSDYSKEMQNLHPDCENCLNWIKHIRKANESRDEYKIDVEKNKNESQALYYSADLQKVIMLPRLNMFKQVIFTPRIIAFNQSFVPLGAMNKKKMPYAVLWHEAVSGRKKEDIISAYSTFLESYARDYEEVTIWADNCTSQNKNWTFFSFLIYIVNTNKIAAKKITIKYFEPGHTYMSADSFHHLVELNLKRHPKCYDFADFANAVRSCKSDVMVKEMQCQDFKKWPCLTTPYQLQKINKNNSSCRPLLKEICLVIAERGKKHLLYKESYADQQYKELYFLHSKYTKNWDLPDPDHHKDDRGIPEDRKVTLLKNLCGLIPEHKLVFWRQLKVNNDSKDLTKCIEDE